MEFRILEVFPADAGMNRNAETKLFQLYSVPRRRGDEPDTQYQ